MERKMKFITKTLTVFCSSAILALPSLAIAQDEAPTQILFTNVQIFDGINEERMAGNVLVEGNMIKQVSAGPINAPDATVVDGGDGTLMPGLIDMHSHLCLEEGMLEGKLAYDQMAMGAFTAHNMTDYLDQGFTTARDAGCNILGIAKAEHQGRIPGPRIFPSGGFLSQTGGHADTGNFNDQPGYVDDLERHGFGYIVDGRAEVMKAARQNLRAGATQIKMMAGGGVASEFDPIHMAQFTEDELRAGVEIAADYGTYVLVHAYHDLSVNRAIDAGVKVIEHNFLVSEKTIRRMKREGVALSLQAVMSLEAFGNPEEITFFSPDQKAKAVQVNEGALQMMLWAFEHDLLIVTGGDMFGAAYGVRQADNIRALTKYIPGVTPYQALKTATSSAGEVLSWSGGMNPYKYGTLGTIAERGYADIIIVGGNPLDSLDALHRDNVKFVMKDGKIFKNSL
jgi:imidazolonepropionase-like amidohydrolase